ncbi:cadherin-related family member 2 [Salvelinus fontinalis]|uniref:cadherin-related family member 2 n=1 Tax=Salvelinus fontinalis TaxID=8038 RepID=UPI0024866BC8|nr:cadherin-related family member 2 [Salvelinus fontinalis]XP_055783829.1 cadherin-related family member 2 [Salvelinus fontinalis]
MEVSFLLLCLVSLFAGAQSQNQIPSITTDYAQIDEDTPIDGFAFQIETYDPDPVPDPLTYMITGPKASYFKVDPDTGRVTIRIPLERDDDDKGVFTIGVVVSDADYTVDKDIRIIVTDANDNRPIFQNEPYNENVPENTALDTVLFQVYAIDADAGLAAVVKYRIDEASPSDGLNQFTINENNGQVKLVKQLNFTSLSTFYRLKINATDGGGPVYNEPNPVHQSSIAFAFITVVDVPDLDPRFLSTPYATTVPEHSPVGKSVFKVTAIDQDTGINDAITYSIEGTNDLFDITANDGIISVKSDIDREALLDTNYVVAFNVTATEVHPSILGTQAHTSTEVRITISDINDNKPKFYDCVVEPCVEASSFTANILEHSSMGVPVDGLDIEAKDLDQGDNGKFELSLAGPDMDVFSVSPLIAYSKSQVQITVKNSQAVDYETKTSMVIQIIAKDPSNTEDCCSTATVTIQIKDINDNSPTFPKEVYNLKVDEHSPNGTTVDTITATDPDTMDVGNIRYRLLPDSILKYFDVNAMTGRIFVTNSKLIDRELTSLYSPTLQARDQANNTGNAVLEITLTDINDQTPQFNRESYVDYVKEGSDLRIQVQATDRDEPPNSEIVYGIVSSNYSAKFTIDPTTGWLENKGPLDREAMQAKDNGQVKLNVTATDKGSPPLSTWVPVIINVEDINDNTPKFEKTSYKFSVEEGKKAAFVGSVQAVDLDQTIDHSRISFSIVSGSFGQFIIRTFNDEPNVYIGNITVDPDIELDYESSFKTFSLDVEAMDLGSMKDTVKVEVIVLDVNDERPEFNPVAPLYIKENTTITGVVGNFEGVDLDKNHSLVYQLVSTNCRCNGSLTLRPCQEDWFILEPTGEIMLNEEFVIDFEKCDQVELEAQVEDECTQKGENNSATSGHIVINIEDINDNAPDFDTLDSLYVVVSETASVGSVIASVTATDRDSGKNRQMTFSITSVQFWDDVNNKTNDLGSRVFRIVTTQEDDKYVGNIHNIEVLNINVKGKYLVTVGAANTEEPKLFSETKLEIFTVDKSLKVELLFSKTVAEVQAVQSQIVQLLTTATKTKVEVVNIRADSASTETRAAVDTVMEVYFVNANGTALDSDTAETILSKSKERYKLQTEFGLKDIGGTVVTEKEVNPFMFGLLGLVAGLIIVLAVMTTSLVCTRRSYRTKLKAAKAMNSAAMVVTGGDQKSGPVVPGTNKYTMEGANPVLNLNIDTATDLGFDEEGSNADRVSLNSLDYNIDMAMSDKDTMPMMMIQEEDEEEWGVDNPHVEPLGEALAQRGKKRDNNSPSFTFANPSLSTTDL